MKLENQVVSLELAKKLKELGVKQESLFYWHHYVSYAPEFKPKYAIDFGKIESGCDEHVSAFTVAELGEMLPKEIQSKNDDYLYLRWIKTSDGMHKIEYIGEVEHHEEWEYTEADARAKMLIYLLENKIITIKQV